MKLIFNNFTKTNHLSEIKSLLGSSKIKKAIISSAFATDSGIYQIEDELTRLNSKVDLFIGFNNGTTDKHALIRAFNSGCNLYAVGLNSLLYHPKIYFVETYTEAKIIIGSANLTNAGLENQYEAGVYNKLDQKKDKTFIRDIIDAHNVIKSSKETKFISSISDISSLDKQGFLKKSNISTSKKSSKKKSQNLPGISNKKTSGLLKQLQKKPNKQAPHIKYNKVNRVNYTLVWKSLPLKARSLNIPNPKKTNTHLTKAINLGKGDKYTAENILNIPDARASWDYFPQKVFTSLKRHKGKMIGKYKFDLEIFGANYGRFNLEVIHDPKQNTKTRNQGNTANSIRWTDDILSIIKNPKLLDKNLSIFKSNNGRHFLISID